MEPHEPLVKSNPGQRVPRQKNLQSYLHLCVLGCFAITQPIFDLLGKSTQFFVARGTAPAELSTFVVLLTVLPGLILSLVHLASGLLGGPFGMFLRRLLVFLCVWVIAAAPAMRLLDGGWGAFGIASVIALLVMAFYQRFRSLQMFLSVLSPAIFIFPILFLLSEGVQKGVFSNDSGIGPTRSAKNSIPVVLVVFDELPLYTLEKTVGVLDRERLPGFAELADVATWYPSASTLSGKTEHAVPMILSGRLPQANVQQISVTRDYPQNLFTLLGPTHKLNVFEQITHLCPETLCGTRVRRSMLDEVMDLFQDASIVWLHTVTPTQLKSALPNIALGWGEFAKPGALKRSGKEKLPGDARKWSNDQWLFDQFISGLKGSSSDKAALHFLHITFPHVPYRFLPSGKQYFRSDDPRADRGYMARRPPEPWLVAQQMQRYLLQLGAADRMLTKLLSVLRAHDQFDRSLIIVTADHGTSFTPGLATRVATKGNFGEVMGVPLFIKYPLQARGDMRTVHATSLDILPTIADVVGLTPTLPFDGVSLRQAMAERVISPRFYSFVKTPAKVRTFSLPLNLELPLERMNRWFNPMGHLVKIDPYALGPFPEALGKPLDEYLVHRFMGVNFTPERGEEFNSIELSGEYVPSFVSGRVSLERSSCVGPVALVALNGVVRATTYVESSREDLVLQAMIPENAFQPRNNQITVALECGRAGKAFE